MEQAQRELLSLNGKGLSILEISHRSKDFMAIIDGAEAGVRKAFGVPDNYRVLFLQGGASLQFGMIPMNLLQGGSADYVHTGEWAKKAIKEAKRFGTVNIAATSEDENFNYIPCELNLTPGARYVHITSNETIGGIQWQQYPQTGTVPLVGDMSSDIFCRPVDVTRFGLIYAGAQKNIGPSGVTLVIIRDDLVEAGSKDLTTMLQYRTHAENGSMYNTPPCFGVYIIKLVMDWLERQGGVAEMEKINRQKADLLYKAIDDLPMYRGTARVDDRSIMNVTFRLSTEELEEKFIAQATAAGMVGLKGHRSVGGCRASIYNAMNLEGVQALVDFMEKFAKENA